MDPSKDINAKMLEILSSTGYTGNTRNLDFTWLTETDDEELKEFANWIMNSITKDNYVTDEQLALESKLKNEGTFIESNEELDEKLAEYGYKFDNNVTDNELIESELEEVNEHTSALICAQNHLKSELEQANENRVRLEESLHEAESNLNTAVAEFVECDVKFKAVLKDVLAECDSYAHLQDHSVKKIIPNFSFAIQSQEFILKKGLFQHNIKSYCNRNVGLSSNLVQNMDGTLVPHTSQSNQILKKLSVIEASLNKEMLNKYLLEAEIVGLQSHLDELKKIDVNDLSLAVMNWKKCGHDDSFNQDVLQFLISSMQIYTDRLVQIQTIPVMIGFVKEKIVVRQNKYDELSNVVELIYRYFAAVDVHWMQSVMEKELLEVVCNIMHTLPAGFQECIKRKKHLEEILNKNSEKSKIGENQLELACLKGVLLPDVDVTPSDVLESANQFINNTKCLENDVLSSINVPSHDLSERYKELNIFNGPTSNITGVSDDVTNIANNIEKKIRTLKDKAASD